MTGERAFIEQRTEGAHAGEVYADVSGEDGVDELVAEGVEIGVRNEARDAGAVYQHVATAVVMCNRGGEGGERASVGYGSGTSGMPVTFLGSRHAAPDADWAQLSQTLINDPSADADDVISILHQEFDPEHS